MTASKTTSFFKPSSTKRISKRCCGMMPSHDSCTDPLAFTHPLRLSPSAPDEVTPSTPTDWGSFIQIPSPLPPPLLTPALAPTRRARQNIEVARLLKARPLDNLEMLQVPRAPPRRHPAAARAAGGGAPVAFERETRPLARPWEFRAVGPRFGRGSAESRIRPRFGRWSNPPAGPRPGGPDRFLGRPEGALPAAQPEEERARRGRGRGRAMRCGSGRRGRAGGPVERPAAAQSAAPRSKGGWKHWAWLAGLFALARCA